MRWQPEGVPWQYVLLDKMKPSIDVSLIEEDLKLTAAERLEALQAMIDLDEEMRRARADQLSKAP